MNNFKKLFLTLLKESLQSSLLLYKIMIPVSIIVKILQMLDWVKYIGIALAPFMKLVGLPGEMGLVWGSGMITNLFGGIIAFISIAPSCNLNIAQVSVLATMMLVAHSFPVELQIARKSGIKFLVMFCIRFFGAILIGIFLNLIYKNVGLLQDKAVFTLQQPKPEATLLIWAIEELKKYAIIFLFVFGLIFLIRILKVIGVINVMTKILNPILGKLGIGKEATTLTIVGLTLGITYGGVLIINEAKSGKLSKRDIFYSMSLMGLCHSIIEDTLLMASLGGHYSGIIVFRLIFAFAMVFLLVKITQRLKEPIFERFLMRNEKIK